MKKILITEATENIGSEVIRFLKDSELQNVVAGVKDVSRAKDIYREYEQLGYCHFDFEDPATYSQAFPDVELLFLLLPPHLSEVEKNFRPLLETAREAGVEKIVFLSVQGAEKNSIIPHHKIEKLIRKFGFEYIFVRPSYFMQNLTTTLVHDIRTKMKIILPSGKAKFNWIDARDIGEVSARLIINFELHKNRGVEITGEENLNFETAAKLISNATGLRIKYKSLDPIRFFWLKRKEGVPTPYNLAMTMLHFLPRFTRKPKVSPYFEQITGHKPTTLKEFVEREGDEFRPSKLRALVKMEADPNRFD